MAWLVDRAGRRCRRAGRDEDPLFRLVAEALIAEQVAAEWWSRNV